jgi:hypothetical protein
LVRLQGGRLSRVWPKVAVNQRKKILEEHKFSVWKKGLHKKHVCSFFINPFFLHFVCLITTKARNRQNH